MISLIQELNKSSPEAVIDYYRLGNIATGEEATKEYIKALAKLGRIEEVDLSALGKFKGGDKTTGEEDKTKHQNPFKDFGSANNPVIVKSENIPSPPHPNSGTESTQRGVVRPLYRHVWSLHLHRFHSSVWWHVRDAQPKGEFPLSLLTHQVNEVIPNEVTTKFSDVIGNPEAKEELKTIVEYLSNPARFSRFDTQLPKGVLLAGPPGCGKTLLARAIAGEANVPFYFCSGSDFEEMFVSGERESG